MWPVDPESDESPSETLLPRRLTAVKAIATPTVVAIATPAMKEAEIFTGFEAVTKMIADIICGPAIIVMARGRICRFMASAPLVLDFPGSQMTWGNKMGYEYPIPPPPRQDLWLHLPR